MNQNTNPIDVINQQQSWGYPNYGNQPSNNQNTQFNNAQSPGWAAQSSNNNNGWENQPGNGWGTQVPNQNYGRS